MAHDPPRGLRRGTREQVAKEAGVVLLGAPVADHALDPAAHHIKAGDQGLGAMALILELAPLDPTGAHRQVQGDALQRLDAGSLIDRHRADLLLGSGRRVPIDRADLGALGLELRVGLGVEPHANPMRLEVSVLLKKRPPCCGRCS